MLVPNCCARLKVLDGLDVNRTALNIRDKVWEALVKDGVVSQASTETKDDRNGIKASSENGVAEVVDPQKTVVEERWQAEDSFA